MTEEGAKCIKSRFILSQNRQLSQEKSLSITKLPEGYCSLEVLYCAICRTDAKMWSQGHRDLALPRVLGHELVGIEKESGLMYSIWPGEACGSCHYCRTNKENLCDEMQIIGFHKDGGFADTVVVPRDSLIPVEQSIPAYNYCFAEPIGCVLNGLEAVELKRGERVIIIGGGVVGLLAALLCKDRGACPIVIEHNQEKIQKASPLLQELGIEIRKETQESGFEVSINACDSPIAFAQCLLKTAKDGRVCFFSGLAKNEELDTNLLNLLHYREIQMSGAYGPRREHLQQAVSLCIKYQNLLSFLIEGIIPPEQAQASMENVLAARSYKYILDFTTKKTASMSVVPEEVVEKEREAVALSDSTLLQELVSQIFPLSRSLQAAAQRKIDQKTKPLGALGRIEALAVKMSCIQNSLSPQVNGKKLFVFAGDHGVVEEGVSAFPSKVTTQMVENFLNGGAAINVFCQHNSIELKVVDMGVNGDFHAHPLLIDKKVRKSTRNFTLDRAMTRAETCLAMEGGARCVLEQCDDGDDLVAIGEMGIGNTSSASAIICAITGIDVDMITGRGTGVDNEGLSRKREVLKKALTFHAPDSQDGLDVLSRLGGFEIAGMTGAILAAASSGRAIILDGLISTAAGLLAYIMCPQSVEYMIAGHRSVEIGQKAALECMGLEPVIDLDMRLGEGTGAAITVNLVELACTIMRDMASFEEAGVDSGPTPAARQH